MAFSLRHSVLISGTRIHFGLIEYISSSPKLISSGIGTRLCSFLCLKQIALYSESCGFPSSHVWLWELAECQIIDAFELWCGRRLMRVPWTARKSNQSILKKINPEYSLVDWCWGWSSKTLATRCEELTHWKLPWYWVRLKTEEGATEDEIVGWHHWLNGHEFGQIPGDSGGQRSLVCCSPWGCKELDTT